MTEKVKSCPSWGLKVMSGLRTWYPKIRKLDILNILSLRKWGKSQKPEVHCLICLSPPKQFIKQVIRSQRGSPPSAWKAVRVSKQAFVSVVISNPLAFQSRLRTMLGENHSPQIFGSLFLKSSMQHKSFIQYIFTTFFSWSAFCCGALSHRGVQR